MFAWVCKKGRFVNKKPLKANASNSVDAKRLEIFTVNARRHAEKNLWTPDANPITPPPHMICISEEYSVSLGGKGGDGVTHLEPCLGYSVRRSKTHPPQPYFFPDTDPKFLFGQPLDS